MECLSIENTTHSHTLIYCFALLCANGNSGVGVIADTKTWLRNMNFDDPANWNGGGVFCSNDRKVFPADMKASIFIQKNESLQELVLSNNMILTFGEGAMLTFNSNPSNVPSSRSQGGISSVGQGSTKAPSTSQCTAKGRVVEFNATASSWFDPSSWNTTNFQIKNDSRRFMLDLERVPCNKDKVVFPAENSFQVDMEGQDLNAGTLVVLNEELTSQEMFDKYWQTEQAGYDFVNKSTTNVITGEKCVPEDRCICPDRYSDEAKARVCPHVKKSDTTTAACTIPVSPTYGQCSPLCGATIDLIFNETDGTDLSFMWEDVQSAILTALDKWPTVMYSIGPFKDRIVQITLKDSGGDGVSASSSVCGILDQLKFNDTAYIQGITQVNIQQSVGVNSVESCFIKPTFAPQQKTSGIDYVILGVALGIGVIFIILVAAGIAIYRRRYHGNLKTEMELGYINNGNRLTSQGFDNPVYNSPLPFDDNFVISYETDNDQITGFENATYVPGPDVKPKLEVTEKKVPLEDSDEPAPSKKSKQKSKKSKEKANLGFDNPVYGIKDTENADSMVSVSLDEDNVVVPDQIEHDGVGFVNPIATGLSESQMSPEPQKESVQKKASQGIENPLYESPGGSQEAASDGSTSPHEITVHATTQSSKKKKAKKNKKSKSAASAADDGDLGFGNPLYGADNPTDFYQPDTSSNVNDFLPPED